MMADLLTLVVLLLGLGLWWLWSVVRETLITPVLGHVDLRAGTK